MPGPLDQRRERVAVDVANLTGRGLRRRVATISSPPEMIADPQPRGDRHLDDARAPAGRRCPAGAERVAARQQRIAGASRPRRPG